MHEILNSLPERSLVLDLGSGGGSFQCGRLVSIRVDLKCPPEGEQSGAFFVQADAAGLPFREGVFEAVIANHSLEHLRDLDGALREVKRTLKPKGSFFASVPDSSTLTDRLYRWLARGGGHVNQINSLAGWIRKLEDQTGLEHVGTRVLFSSLCFLNRKNRIHPAPRKLLLLGGGREWTLRLAVWLFRALDRVLKTRTGVYGWALYFGHVESPIDLNGWANVCVRCGSASPSRSIERSTALVRRRFLRDGYNCAACGAWNFFFRDGEGA